MHHTHIFVKYLPKIYLKNLENLILNSKKYHQNKPKKCIPPEIRYDQIDHYPLKKKPLAATI